MTINRGPHPGEPHDDLRRTTTLIGRDSELGRLDAFLTAVRSDGGAILLSGEPGVGKTGLLSAASEMASAAGMRFIHAAGVEFEAETSFSGLNQVLLPVLDRLKSLEVVQRQALNVALGFSDGAPPSRLVVSNATLMLLRQAATRQALLVVIDDLPWLDRASAGVLSFVARRLEGTRVGLLGASRTSEPDFFDRVGLAEIEVGRLDETASRLLLDRHHPGLRAPARERVLLEAQGNPLALLELPVAVAELLRDSGGALPPALPLSRRLQSLYGSRIVGLPSATRSLLLMMALDGTGDVRILQAHGPARFGADDLVPAERARLAYLDHATHRFAFRHPLMRSAVVELAEPHERRAAHRALAAVWENQPERRAWHLAEATVEPDEDVAAQLEAIAGRVLGRGDAVGSVKALTRAADLSPNHLDRSRRLAAAAYIGAEVTGDLSRASDVFSNLRRGDTDLQGSLPAALAASTYLMNADGDITIAHRLLVHAIQTRIDAEDGDGDQLLDEALNTLMMVCYYGGTPTLWKPFDEIARTTTVRFRAIQHSKTYADPVRALPDDVALLEQEIEALDRVTDPSQIVRTGIAAVYVNRMGGCRDALWRVVADGRRGGALASGLTAMIILAYDDWFVGNWDEADALLSEAVGLADSIGFGLQAWPAKLVRALIASARGDDHRTAEFDAVLEWAQPRGFGVVDWYASQARGLAALGRGDYEEAYRQVSRITPPGTLASHVPHAVTVLMDLVESAVHTGRTADAAAHVRAMQDADLASLSSRLALVAGGSAAIVAEGDDAVAMFEATLALPGIERWQFDLARVQLAFGERLRRNRKMARARAQLNAAIAAFERLGARPWVDRAMGELRGTGQTKPHAGESVLVRLTPQELEIVTLAASGLTNRQIGERLFLSHRTVGGHLHRAFPKLEVTTRAALRDALARIRPEQLPPHQGSRTSSGPRSGQVES